MLRDCKQCGELSSSLYKDADQLVSRTARRYLQQVIKTPVHFLDAVCNAKMLKDLCLEFLEDNHYESSVSRDGLNSRECLLLGIPCPWSAF
jgi:hypothetical protein